jgi:hypothetical protein
MRGLIIKLLLFLAAVQGLAQLNLMVLLAGIGVGIGVVVCVDMLMVD